MEYTMISYFKFIPEKVNIHLGNNIFDEFYKYGKGESQKWKTGKHIAYLCTLAHLSLNILGVLECYTLS